MAAAGNPPGLGERFRELHDRDPTHAVRAPGRVNLIGEHVDYHDLPVMPFAIDRSIELLVAPRTDSLVRIANLDERFEPDEFELGDGPEPVEGGDWRNYPRAAAAFLPAEAQSGADWSVGMDVLVASNLPTAAGLSSSSALVVAVGLALARVNRCLLGRRRFAAMMAEAERFTGTQGGGMDQAASVLSREGQVSVVSFDPLEVEHVPFPEECVVLVVDSGERAEKSGAQQAEYNERRRTGAEAAAIVAAALGCTGRTFRALLAEHDVDMLLRTGEEELDAHALSRFRHVVTESERVRAARAALGAGDLAGLGRLLDSSHQSLRDDYGVSTDRLDELVVAAREGGAWGARLTGAGFGGSVIVLVAAEKADGVISSLQEVAVDPDASVFRVRPAAGATVSEVY